MVAMLITAAKPAAVLMRGNPPFTRRVIESAPQLKIIAKHGAGVDSVDVQAAAQRSVAVMTAGAANADAVAEFALALMLALARELPRLDRGVKAGTWERPHYQGGEFRGRTVGIVGSVTRVRTPTIAPGSTRASACGVTASHSTGLACEVVGLLE